MWGDLLEPFLDTEFTTERKAATQARLEQAGPGPDEVAGIRDKVAPLMRADNSFGEDWHHLGVADLLNAATADWIPQHQQIKPGEVAAFRAWAMRIYPTASSPTRTIRNSTSTSPPPREQDLTAAGLGQAV
ncbi:hypothetical protein [Streptomyces sp. Isolate_45]|uniref:hypothetical protein n=1 Tax=Streptomyces sp. Isolate_45 TaxID=2950111 RepID=UPI002481D03E|nr:hypothetical protein [Streptomyces sp. Isolate_45]MDA5284721.1 hypothetical protein [Streptomyces sp. Isolate_45]